MIVYTRSRVKLELDKIYLSLGYNIVEALGQGRILERKGIEITRTDKGKFEKSKKLELHEKFQRALIVPASDKKPVVIKEQLENTFT